MPNLAIQFFNDAEKFIFSLKEADRVKIFSSIEMLSIDYESVYTKMVRTPIRELIVKKYRILFFIHKSTIYIVRGFIKRTQKTPKDEIEKAESVYKLFLNK